MALSHKRIQISFMLALTYRQDKHYDKSAQLPTPVDWQVSPVAMSLGARNLGYAYCGLETETSMA